MMRSSWSRFGLYSWHYACVWAMSIAEKYCAALCIQSHTQLHSAPEQHGMRGMHAGDSHTMALTEKGFIYGWGTFRNSSGVFGLSTQDRLALMPVLVYSPASPAQQAVKIVSGQDCTAQDCPRRHTSPVCRLEKSIYPTLFIYLSSQTLALHLTESDGCSLEPLLALWSCCTHPSSFVVRGAASLAYQFACQASDRLKWLECMKWSPEV